MDDRGSEARELNPIACLADRSPVGAPCRDSSPRRKPRRAENGFYASGRAGCSRKSDLPVTGRANMLVRLVGEGVESAHSLVVEHRGGFIRITGHGDADCFGVPFSLPPR